MHILIPPIPRPLFLGGSLPFFPPPCVWVCFVIFPQSQNSFFFLVYLPLVFVFLVNILICVRVCVSLFGKYPQIFSPFFFSSPIPPRGGNHEGKKMVENFSAENSFLCLWVQFNLVRTVYLSSFSHYCFDCVFVLFCVCVCCCFSPSSSALFYIRRYFSRIHTPPPHTLSLAFLSFPAIAKLPFPPHPFFFLVSFFFLPSFTSNYFRDFFC